MASTNYNYNNNSSSAGSNSRSKSTHKYSNSSTSSGGDYQRFLEYLENAGQAKTFQKKLLNAHLYNKQ